MSDGDSDEVYRHPDGHRYDAPEDQDTTDNKSVIYLLLGGLVLLLLILMATGVVPIFPS